MGKLIKFNHGTDLFRTLRFRRRALAGQKYR